MVTLITPHQRLGLATDRAEGEDEAEAMHEHPRSITCYTLQAYPWAEDEVRSVVLPLNLV